MLVCLAISELCCAIRVWVHFEHLPIGPRALSHTVQSPYATHVDHRNALNGIWIIYELMAWITKFWKHAQRASSRAEFNQLLFRHNSIRLNAAPFAHINQRDCLWRVPKCVRVERALPNAKRPHVCVCTRVYVYEFVIFCVCVAFFISVGSRNGVLSVLLVIFWIYIFISITWSFVNCLPIKYFDDHECQQRVQHGDKQRGNSINLFSSFLYR